MKAETTAEVTKNNNNLLDFSSRLFYNIYIYIDKEK